MTTTEKTEQDLIKAYEREYDITLEALPETVRVRGNASASGDDELDRDEENAILVRLDMGDVWAWCTAKVTVRDSHGREASDYLGCCSYKDEKDFKRGGYYLDMIKACIEEIENADPLEIEEEDPETKSIITEAAWFAFRHHYKDLAEYLDLSDEVLQPIKEQLDKQLNN
jgi:hypothetical protein